MKDACFLLEPKPEPDITVVYIHVVGSPKYHLLTRRFVETYQKHPPGVNHRMVVVSQGGEPYPDMREMLGGLGEWEIFLNDNTAWDIGAFQSYSKVCGSKMLVCLSGTTYFRRGSWLKRAWDVFQKYDGLGLFGACGNRGKPEINAWPHIRTSSMWFSPATLSSFPYQIKDMAQRYPFEHGPSNFTLWCRAMRLPTVVVDFSNHWDWGDWGRNPRGYHQSDQYDLLIGDRNTEPPDYPYP